MAMDIDPFSMLEVSLQEGPEIDSPRVQNASSGVMHQVENDVQIIQPPPPLHFYGPDVLTPQRAVLQNIQKLSATSKEEEKFRRRAYSSISLVLRKRLHCTICDAHIGAYLGLKDMDIEHPLLKVLACSKCTLKYHYLDFPLNVDGRDIRCRWCTNSSKEESPLRFCNYCPFAFCEMCIYRNLPLDELASNKNNWICFVCNVKDLWPSRAVLWALRVLIDTNLALKEEKKWSTDQSTCCKNKVSKQRRIIPMSQGVGQPTNGHNVAVRAVLPNHQVRLTTHNNYLVPINRASIPIVRPVLAPQSAYRPVITPVQPVRPITVPAVIGNSSVTQLYDTSWLTEKVSNISTTLLNLNNNLHRLAQGIPEKENKYSIKSKMISMVSLLNISATQLQKASKEMEEESKRILDKNYRVARINPVLSETKPPVASTSKCPPSLGKRPPPRNRTSSSSKRSKRYRGIHTDSDSDPDDPDFRTKAKVDGFSDDDYVPGPEDDTSRSSTRSYETRACFVKLERLNYKYVAGYDSGSEDAKSDAGNRPEEPQPSTSSAPDPVVPSSNLPDSDRREADSGIVGVEDRGEGLNEKKTEVAEQKSDDVATPNGTEDNAASKDCGRAIISEESDNPVALIETDDAEASAGPKNTAARTESENPAACLEPENPATRTDPKNGAACEESEDAAVWTEPKSAAACTDPENPATWIEPKNGAACEESEDAAVCTEPERAAARAEPEDVVARTELKNAAACAEQEKAAVCAEPINAAAVSREDDIAASSKEVDDFATCRETNDEDEQQPELKEETQHSEEGTGIEQFSNEIPAAEEVKETDDTNKSSLDQSSESSVNSKVDAAHNESDMNSSTSSTDSSSTSSDSSSSSDTSKSD